MPVSYACHVGICVSDPERSLHFYRDILGFQELTHLYVEGEPTATQLGVPDIKLHARILERDSLRIELLHYASGHEDGDAPRPMNRLGLSHLALRCDDLKPLLARIEAAGGRRLTYIENEAWKSAVALVTDPDGTTIELVSMPGDPSVPVGDPA